MFSMTYLWLKKIKTQTYELSYTCNEAQLTLLFQDHEGSIMGPQFKNSAYFQLNWDYFLHPFAHQHKVAPKLNTKYYSIVP